MIPRNHSDYSGTDDELPRTIEDGTIAESSENKALRQ